MWTCFLLVFGTLNVVLKYVCLFYIYVFIVWYVCLYDTFNVIVYCMFVCLFDRPKLPNCLGIYHSSMRLAWKWQNKEGINYNNISILIKTKLPVLFEVMTFWLLERNNSHRYKEIHVEYQIWGYKHFHNG